MLPSDIEFKITFMYDIEAGVRTGSDSGRNRLDDAL
jgi:hypothetical protein